MAATGTGSPSTHVVTAAGVAFRSPPYSRILPNSTAKISHARIIKTERSPERAQYFFEILKEKVA